MAQHSTSGNISLGVVEAGVTLCMSETRGVIGTLAVAGLLHTRYVFLRGLHSFLTNPPPFIVHPTLVSCSHYMMGYLLNAIRLHVLPSFQPSLFCPLQDLDSSSGNQTWQQHPFGSPKSERQLPFSFAIAASADGDSRRSSTFTRSFNSGSPEITIIQVT